MRTERTLPAAILLAPVLLALLAAGAAADRGATGGEGLSPALSSLIETERAFARTSGEKGIRDSFLAYFADDGIVFRGQPVAFKDFAAAHPVPATPPQPALDWEPIWADVSAAGDLGWTTGPWVLTDRGPDKHPPQRGYFFTIWKRASDGAPWRVAVDAGVPDERAPLLQSVRFQASPHPGFAKGVKPLYPEAAQKALAEAEAQLASDVAAHGMVEAYVSRFDATARIARPGSGNGYLAGSKAIRLYLDKQEDGLAFEPPLKVEVARSGDLGYAYGAYRKMKPGTQKVTEKGHYVRVWRWSPDGRWKIVYDTEQPVPPEQK